MSAMNSNTPSPPPHLSCPNCKARLRMGLDPAKPEIWTCGPICLNRALNVPPPERAPGFIDGGNPGASPLAGRLREAERAQAAQDAARTQSVGLTCKTCREATLYVSSILSPAQIQAHLKAHGWTADGFCGSTCASNAPRPANPPPLEGAGAPINDISYQRSRALARRNAGLPELPEHRGLLALPHAAPPPPARPSAKTAARARQ